MLDTFILAGGESRRFGSNKLLYVLNGKRLIDTVVENARMFSRRLFLVTKEVYLYREVDCDGIIRDVLQERASIVGLLTALLHAKDNDIIVLSGDMPFVDSHLISLLLNEHSFNYTVFNVDNTMYPFPGIYSSCLTLDLYRLYGE